MKAVQGISQSYSHLGSDFFFSKIFQTLVCYLFRFRVQEQTEYGQHQGSSGNFFIFKVYSQTQGVIGFIFYFLSFLLRKQGSLDSF